MCGISGILNKKEKQININEVKLLLIYNSTRGTDAFGIAVDGKLIKRAGWIGSSNEGDAALFFHHHILPQFKGKYCIMHNRSKTIGTNTIENAHPFRYEVEGKEFIFAHNGTIKNIDELKEKYDVKDEDLRGATDSEVLGYILVHRGFDVIEEYVGAAAFSLYNVTDNELYLFKGHSKHDNYTAASEERPLHFAFTRKGLMYSSLSNTLNIVLNDNLALEVPDNTLLRMNADCILEETIFDRSKIEYAYKSKHTIPSYNTQPTYYSKQNNYNNGTTHNKGSEIASYVRELNPQNKVGSKVYYYSGKLYYNGHPLTGCYKVTEYGGVYSINGIVTNEALANYPLFEIKAMFGFWLKSEAYAKVPKTVMNVSQFFDLYPDEVTKPNTLNNLELLNIVHPDFLAIIRVKNANSNVVMAYKLIRNGVEQLLPTLPKFGHYLYKTNNNGSVETTELHKETAIV